MRCKDTKAGSKIVATLLLRAFAALLALAASAHMPREIVKGNTASSRHAPMSAQSKQRKKSDDLERFIEKVRKPGRKSREKPAPRRPRQEAAPPAVPQMEATETRAPGTLLVMTEPPDADVVIKNQGTVIQEGRSEQGRFEAELPPGEYEIEVSAAKRTAFTGKALVQPGATETVTAELPHPGAIIIDLGQVEPDVMILLDGQKPASVQKTAENEIELEDIHAGAHRLRFSHPTIKDLEMEVEVISGAKTTINPPFNRLFGKLVVTSEPGADIYIDGKHECIVTETGKTAVISIAAGRHTIKAVKDGYAPSELTKVFGVGEHEADLSLTRLKPGKDN